MNTTELPVRADVTAFVARVRELLADLPEEERLELTEGLEADLTDQVAEHGGAVLGDPEAYARELRSAAGLEPVARRGLRLPPMRQMPLSERVDVVRGWWDAQVARPRVEPVWSVVVALRPFWWVARAWIAAVIVCIALPGYDIWGFTWLPGVSNELGLAVLAVCVVLSTLVGMGRLWPGGSPTGSRGVTARLVLVGLNLFAIAMVPFAEQEYQNAEWRQDEVNYVDNGWGYDSTVLNKGYEVCNISAYDASGQPLTGVQLFDQDGRPISVSCYDQQSTKVPWVLGDVTRWNVFPLGERARPARTERRREDMAGATFPTPDRATTPPVTNPLLPPPAEEVDGPDQTGGQKTDGQTTDGRKNDGRKTDGQKADGRKNDQRR